MCSARALAPWLLVACGSSQQLTAIGLPEESFDTFAVRAGSLGSWVGTTDEPVRVLEGDSESLEVALYTQSLAELGLKVGPLSALSTSCRSCELLSTGSVFERARSASWAPSSLSADLAIQLVPDLHPRCTCANFGQRYVDLPFGRNVKIIAAEREPSGSVLLASASGALARVLPDYSSESICDASHEVGAASLEPTGTLWIATARRLETLMLSEQSPGQPCSVSSSTTADFLEGQVIRNISAGEGEVIGVTRGGLAFRFDGQFRVLTTVPAGESDRFTIQLLGERRALVSVHTPQVLWIDGDSTRFEEIRPNSSVEAIAVVPGVGAVLALPRAIAIPQGTGGWQTIDVPEWTGAGKMIPYGTGIFATTDHGNSLEVSGTWRPCPVQPAFTKETVYHVARLGDDAILLGDIITSDDRPSQAGLLFVKPWCGN